MSQTNNTNTDDCWLWARQKNKAGYGFICLRENRKKYNIYGHRLMYETYVGLIREGMTIDHLCKVTSCVNPDHLEQVTMKENLQRAWVFRNGGTILKTHCIRGHKYEGRNIVVQNKKYRSCRICGNMLAKLRYQKYKQFS